MNTQRYLALFSLSFFSVGSVLGDGAKQTQPLVVHEWGTFTVLQDDAGNPVDGVNINEESLPGFVHKLATDLAPDSHELGPLVGLGYFQPQRSKGIRRYYHAARMRMETPVIYLYPPKDQPKRPIDVEVRFKGGWVTEWYPNAAVKAPGYKQRQAKVMMNLKPHTTGSIQWSGLEFAPEAQPPVTEYPVWLAPRATAAPMLKTAKGEAENYLFYRGVANLEAPLRVVREGDTLTVRNNPNTNCPIDDLNGLELWLVDVAANGELQYRRVSVDLREDGSGHVLAKTAASFDKAPGKGMAMLREEMLESLVKSGLYRDEAEAMLNTWKVSYFETSGLRLFFTLPQSWTDEVLPLQVSGYDRTETVRAMIGRIELISAKQRSLVDKIAKGPASTRAWFSEALKTNPAVKARTRELINGLVTLEEVGLKPPADYQAYMDLGRFRDALIRHEIKHPRQPETAPGVVQVTDNLIKIRHPDTSEAKVASMTISLPGEKRTINLGELRILSESRDVAPFAKYSASSNYQWSRPPTNLIDGDRNTIVHTDFEKDPWIKVEFARPISIDEVQIWNRPEFLFRFDGARVSFHGSEGKTLGTVQLRTPGHGNLRNFAKNYGLPAQ